MKLRTISSSCMLLSELKALILFVKISFWQKLLDYV